MKHASLLVIMSLVSLTLRTAAVPGQPPFAAGPQRGGSGGGSYSPGGGPSSTVNLLKHPLVQKELNLGIEQQEAVSSAARKLHEAEAAFSAAGKSQRRFPTAEYRQVMNLLTRIEGDLKAQLQEAQKARLEEIRLQVQGAQALFRPEIARALKLTSAQQRQLERLSAEANRQAFQWTRQKGVAQKEGRADDANSAGAKLAETLKTYDQRMLEEVLTPQQQKQFAQMQGRKLDLPAQLSSGGSGSGGGRR